MNKKSGKESLHKEIDKIRNRDGFKAQLSSKGITIDFSREDIEENLPNLSKELNDPNGMQFSLKDYEEIIKDSSEFTTDEEIEEIPEISLSPEEIKKNVKDNVKSKYDIDSELYYPKTQDFLRRCSNIQEAKEILDYQVKMKEISIEEGKELLKICEEKGLEYFGPKKEPGYYERTYRRM